MDRGIGSIRAALVADFGAPHAAPEVDRLARVQADHVLPARVPDERPGGLDERAGDASAAALRVDEDADDLGGALGVERLAVVASDEPARQRFGARAAGPDAGRPDDRAGCGIHGDVQRVPP